MIDFLQKIKSIVRLPSNHHGVVYDRPGIKPSHDWKILLLSTVVVLAFLAGLAFYLYIQINNGSFFIVTNESTERKIKIDTKLLDKTVKEINDREKELIEIKQGRAVPSDPSL